jgi:hypothetical protein
VVDSVDVPVDSVDVPVDSVGVSVDSVGVLLEESAPPHAARSTDIETARAVRER